MQVAAPPPAKAAKPPKSAYPRFTDPNGTTYTIYGYAVDVRARMSDETHGQIVGTGWEWYALEPIKGDVVYGFVHGAEDEYGSFSISELKENGVKFVTDPKDLAAIQPPIGWKAAEAEAPKRPPTIRKPKAETPTPAPKTAAPPTSAEIIKGFAKEGITGIDEAIKGLNELFGGGAHMGTFGPGFNEQTYAKAKPHFRKALDAVIKAGKSLKDFLRHLRDQFKETWEAMKVYVKRFVQEVQAEERDAIQTTAKKGDPADVEGNEHQTRYPPASKGEPFGTLTPRNIAEAERQALENLQKVRGQIDEWVASEVNMSVADLHKVVSSEQIDGAALAIHQIMSDGALIIGDMTGIGKGRQGALVLRWAIFHGKIPVFFTADPKLFSDMWGDLRDINTEIKPFILGSPEKASIKDTDDQLIIRAPGLQRQENEIRAILENGLNARGYNAIFATYSQINDRNNRQAFLEALAQQNPVVLVLDESHLMAGNSETSMQAAFFAGGQIKRGKGANIQTITLPGLLNFVGTKTSMGGGVLYMSATFAKRADNMPAYFRTALSKAASSFGAIVEAMKKGGVAMQQAASEALAKSGQYVRRERSFKGARYDTVSVQVADPVKLLDEVDGVTDVLSQIMHFSGAIRDAVAHSTAQTQTQVDMTDFASIVHNQVGQLLLGAKADEVVKKAIEAKQRGEKPVIALMNTMESFLDHFTEDRGIEPGQPIQVRWNELLEHALSRLLRITTKLPNGDSEISTADPAEFGLGDLYQRTLEACREVECSFPISPIDYIIQKLRKAGVSMSELTGRTTGIEYVDFEKGTGIYRKFKKANKNTVVNRFNHGDDDGMLLNASGSTGLSAHASVKTKDKRPRHMLIVQPALDIAVFVQTLGRIFRTGLLTMGTDEMGKPYGAKYSYLMLPLQAEIRPAANAAKKMKSLNANTTAESESAVKIQSADLFNKIGDLIASEYLDEHEDLQRMLGIDIDHKDDGTVEVKPDTARKLTGRMALLPDHSQKQIYDFIIPAYNQLVEQLKATGEYDLEIIVHDDWDAVRQSDDQLSAGTDESNIFTASVRVQQWEIKDTRHVPTGREMFDEFKRRSGSIEQMEVHWQAYQQRMTEFIARATAEVEKIREEAAAKPDNGLLAALVTTKESQLHALSDRWTATKNEVDKVISELGRVVQLTNNDTGDTYTAILVEIRLPGRSSAAASGFKLRYAVNSPGGVQYLNVSNIVTGKWTVEQSDTQISDIHGGNQGQRYVRHFVVGNPFKAFEATGGRGKLVRFKAQEGETVTGLIMPNNWDVSKLANDPRMDLITGNAVRNFLSNNRESVESANVVRIEQTWQGFKISTSSSRRTGGAIYLDPQVRRTTGDFEKRGNRMVATVQANDLPKVADRIMQITEGKFRPVGGDPEDMRKEVAKANGPSKRQGSLTFPEARAQEPLPVSVQEAGYQSEEIMRADYQKNGLHKYRETLAEFAMRRYCAGTSGSVFYKVGQKVRRGGKTWTVTGFAPSGEPIVE